MRETRKEAVLRRAIEDEYSVSDGANNDELQRRRYQALHYYRGDKRGDEIDGRSSVISQDLNASVTNNLALMRQMLIEDGAVEIEADGDQDILAEAETQICERIIFDENEGELAMLHAIRDGLLSGNAVMNVEVIERKDDNGDPLPNEYDVRAVPSEMVAYETAYDGPLQDVRFFAETRYYMRSDLVEMGISEKKVASLGTGIDFNERDRFHSRKSQAGSDAADTIECRWNYIRCDLTDSGTVKLYRVLTGPNTEILIYDEVTTIPYVMGVPFINPHRLTGESLFDKLKQTQDTNTALMRQFLDNVALINNGRYVYDPMRVTESDVLAPIAGGGIRANDVSGIMPLVIPDASSGILGALEFMKRKRSEVSGAAIDMASAEAQIMNKSATQASIDKSNSELVASLIARNFALTLVKPLFALVHTMVREHGNAPMMATVNGQPVIMVPQMFRQNPKLSMRVGKTPSEKNQETQGLMMHLQSQAQAMQAGMDGVLANARTLYETSKRLLELAKVENPERYLINPDSPAAQQAAQQQAQSAQQQAQAQQQLIDRQLAVEERKIAADLSKHQGDLQHDYYATDAQIAMTEAKIAGDSFINVRKEAMNGRGGQDNDRAVEGTGQ